MAEEVCPNLDGVSGLEPIDNAAGDRSAESRSGYGKKGLQRAESHC